MRRCIGLKPKLVAEISFREWTREGNLRQPIFLGLRSDKTAKEVRRERPIAAQTSAGGSEEISHPDKVFWPKEKITKGQLADYYRSIADTILPYLKDRPESLNRHPNGINGDSFYQKDLEKHPDWIKTVPLYSESNDKNINWLVANDQANLMYMINLGCIELNPWLSRVKTHDRPDFCLLDIDAKTSSFNEVITVAKEAHKMLDELNVPNFVKTSGKTGLHICIPLDAKYSYEQSKLLAEILMRRLHQRLPKLTSVDRKPDKRGGKIYLDFLQNRKGQTMAAPYCVRPVPGVPVSTPLKWSEVKKGLDPTKFNIHNTEKRLAKVETCGLRYWAPAST
jgi:bifunctional non-homologous end joining protein LigD